jgi:hypothetical protein
MWICLTLVIHFLLLSLVLGDEYRSQFSTAPTKGVSGKLWDLFLVSRTAIVSGFCQVSVRWSDHDVMLLSVRVELSQGIEFFRGVRSFRVIDIGELLSAAAMLDWKSV